MSNKKQTAVEWLEEAINNKLSNQLSPYFIELFEEAKKMERAQILRANLDGLIKDKRLIEMDIFKTTAKMLNYYDKTYGS
jgi:hypothetical protein